MSIKITSDSTCDLTPELLSKHEIEILPLTVVKGGAPYRDSLEITTSDIFRHVENGGEITTTSAVSVGEYQSCFARLSPLYEAVIHINIGSGFSACHQNATIAASEFDNVYTIDSCNLSSGQGHIVVEAALAAESGMALQDILTYLRGLVPRVESSFILNRLDYMVKGGRCSAVTMLGANLLKLKPCIDVMDGSMKVTKKFRGNLEKCAVEYVKDRLKNRDDLELDRIFITHSLEDHALVEKLIKEIVKYAPFQSVIETRTGCTISSHCGPNTVGILFIRSR